MPALLFLLLGLACAQSYAQAPSAEPAGMSDDELAAKVNNPVAAMISVPIQTELYFGVGPNKTTVYATQFKPVVPFVLNSKWNLLSRVILPVAHVPDLFGGPDFLPQNASTGSSTGIGDIAVSAWLVPRILPRVGKGQMIYGVGPAVLLPTARSGLLGTGKWAAGPSALAGYMVGKSIFGGLVQNVWSFAGHSQRAALNHFTVQPFFSCRLGKGWSATVSPAITSNWRAARDRWTIPVGGGISRLVRIGRMPVSLGAEAFAFPVRPEGNGPRWTVRLNLNLLLPR